MTGLIGCWIRRMAGVVGVVVAVSLIAAPAALANNNTITAQATVQFSGPVDSPTSCSGTAAGGTATIDWGDSSATSNGAISGNTVSGTHTYATKGTYSGTITI
ncbi:MAG TPA: hypothetical protein VG057_02850, partial [Solirubrobacteraceae bacterium]|nr:hypothetical protein [Solirubrobacteraceae bacterium]